MCRQPLIAGVNLTVLLVWYPEEGNLTEVVGLGLQEFEKLNSQVTILEQAIPVDEIPERFFKQSQSGLGASVILIFSRNIPRLVSQGVLEEIDQNNLDLSIYYPPTLKQVSYQGKIYGIPLGSRTNVLCYNQKKLQVSPDPALKQPPTSLGGLVERARKGYSVGIVSSFEDTFWGMAIFGGYLWDDQGRLQPRLDGWAKWLEWLKFASSQPNFILNRQRELLHDAFAGGRLTYYVCNSIEIADNALVAAALLSNRYISDRFLPDKAIDLVDEAAAKLKMEITSKPEELDEIDRKILQLEMEKLSLQREYDPASRERLEKLEKELANLKEEQSGLNAQWQGEKEIIDKVRGVKEAIEQVNLEIQQAERDYDYYL